jgi:hypothetical protein
MGQTKMAKPFQTEADSVKIDTDTDLEAYKIRQLIHIIGRDLTYELLEEHDL